MIDPEKILTRNKFIKKLKYFSRGLNDTKVLEEMLKYYNDSEKYISDLELENFRLSLENEQLTKDINNNAQIAMDALGWLQSLLIRKTNRLIKETKCSSKIK